MLNLLGRLDHQTLLLLQCLHDTALFPTWSPSDNVCDRSLLPILAVMFIHVTYLIKELLNDINYIPLLLLAESHLPELDIKLTVCNCI